MLQWLSDALWRADLQLQSLPAKDAATPSPQELPSRKYGPEYLTSLMEMSSP